MEKIKNFFSSILGTIIFISSVLLLGSILIFGAYIAEKVNPILVDLSVIITFICILVLLPLAIFKKTRIISFYGIFISSYIFGISLWVFSFLTTYYYWGIIGVILGLFIMGVGVLPFAVIVSLFYSDWSSLGNIIFMIILTFGSRLFSLHLAKKIDKETYLQEKIKQTEIIINDPEYVWACDYCGKEFDSEEETDNHEKVCDLKNKKISAKKKIYCTQCGEENLITFIFCKKCGAKIIH